MKTTIENFHTVDLRNESQITSEMEDRFNQALIEILG